MCVCLLLQPSSSLFSTSLFHLSFPGSAPPRPDTPPNAAKGKTGWAAADDITASAARWRRSDGLCMLCVFTWDSVGVVEVVLVKELL